MGSEMCIRDSARPSQNKLIWFSYAVLLFVAEWRQKLLFLMSELANKAEINILLAQDTKRAWVPGWGIMGSHVGVYKTRYNTWLSSRLQNQTCSLASLIFLCLALSFLGTMHSV